MPRIAGSNSIHMMNKLDFAFFGFSLHRGKRQRLKKASEFGRPLQLKN